MNSCQMQLRPKPGQFLLALNLEQIELEKIDESIDLIERMGFKPVLRYYINHSEKHLWLYALLMDEQLDPMVRIAPDYRLEERLKLYRAFEGNEDAIVCLMG